MEVQKSRVLSGSLRKLLRRNARGHVLNLLGKLHPGDIANLFNELNPREQLQGFEALVAEKRALAAEVVNELGLDRGLHLLLAQTPPQLAKVLQELETDDRAVLISGLPPDVAESVLEQMGVEQSVEVQELLQYPEETAGRIMTPNVFALQENLTVAEAIHTIQTTLELEMVFYLYVVDDRNHLVGVASLRQLLTVPASSPLRRIMQTDLIWVRTDTDQEEVASQVALYDLLAIPVVDDENKLVGVITVDDVIDVIKDEATEDILHLAGVERDDHLHTNARSSVRKRLPWLAVNLVMAMIAATVVAYYEPVIAALPVLAMFLPVVAGMGGNCGTQTLTLMVRALALGEISWKNTRKVLFKETLVGGANGLSIGILAGLVVFIWKGDLWLGFVLGAALISNMFLAGLVGTLIPLVLKKLNVDPAIASGIFLHTLTDVVGFFSFLTLSAVLLS